MPFPFRRGGPRRDAHVVPAGGLRDGVRAVLLAAGRWRGGRGGLGLGTRIVRAAGALPAPARALPVLRHGLLLGVPRRVAPRRHLVRGEPAAPRRARPAARPAAPLRLGPHQALPHVPGAHREGRGLRADDVQALQARLLLVLPRLARREYAQRAGHPSPVDAWACL